MVMGLPKINSCCLCGTLETGCLVIGWIIVLGTITNLLYAFVIDGLPLFYLGLSARTGLSQFLSLIVGITLLMGTYKRKAGCLRSYMIVNVLAVAILAITFVLMLVINDESIKRVEHEMSPTKADPYKSPRLLFLAVLALLLVLGVYCLLVVNSYYSKIRKELLLTTRPHTVTV